MVATEEVECGRSRKTRQLKSCCHIAAGAKAELHDWQRADGTSHGETAGPGRGKVTGRAECRSGKAGNTRYG
jgi:hypothetical protein